MKETTLQAPRFCFRGRGVLRCQCRSSPVFCGEDGGGAGCATVMEILCRSRCQAGTEDHGGSGGLSGAAIHGRPMLEQSVPEEWTPWYKPILEMFLKNYCLWEAHILPIWEGLHSMRGTSQWKRGRVRMKE